MRNSSVKLRTLNACTDFIFFCLLSCVCFGFLFVSFRFSSLFFFLLTFRNILFSLCLSIHNCYILIYLIYFVTAHFMYAHITKWESANAYHTRRSKTIKRIFNNDDDCRHYHNHNANNISLVHSVHTNIMNMNMCNQGQHVTKTT